MNGHLLLAFLWILYGVMHSLLAAHSVKQWVALRFPRLFLRYRLLYTVFAFVTLVLLILYEVRLPTVPVLDASWGYRIAGGVIGGLGLLIMTLCILKYFGKLSGLKTVFRNPVNSGNTLIVSGMHQYVRHPLYLGTFLAIWGLFLIIPVLSLLLSNFIITGYTLIAIRFEETKLISEFGDAYVQYRKRVPAILPYRKVGGKI